LTTGTVKRWMDRSGYGFITTEDGKDVFVHNSAIQGKSSLKEGEKVEFEITETPRGPKALNVKSIS